MTANQDRCNKNQVFPCSCVSCNIDKEKAKKRKEKKRMECGTITLQIVFICKGHFPKWMRGAGWKVILQDSFQSSSVWPASKQNKTKHNCPYFRNPVFFAFIIVFNIYLRFFDITHSIITASSIWWLLCSHWVLFLHSTENSEHNLHFSNDFLCLFTNYGTKHNHLS